MSKSGRIVASDGLLARDNGPWAREKLSFLDDFIPPALKATERKLQRYYVDLFAGPGVNVDSRAERAELREFEGSALRALSLTAPSDERIHFTHAVLVNKDRESDEALRLRLTRLSEAGRVRPPLTNIEPLCGDSNQLIHRILRGIHPLAYVLVFADIEAPNQLPWATVKALRAHGHQSIELYVLFPLEMAINRMISFNRVATESNARALTTFFGDEQWRALADSRVTDVQSPRLREQLLDLYMGNLRRLDWPHVRVVRDVRRVGNAGLYKMILATAHTAGEGISRWAANRARRGDQGELF